MLNYEQGHLKFEGESQLLSSFISDYQEPIYVYNSRHLSFRAKALKEALPANTEIYYALKANDHKDILRLFIQLGIGMDVVSLGELTWSLEQGCSPHKIIFSGIGKTEKELVYALKVGVRQINVESLPELRRISSLTQKLQVKASIGLRVNPDVDVQTHPYIATGLKNNKFGIEVDALDECDRILKSNSLLQFKGFSLHIGSQLVELSAFSEAYDKLIPVISKWKSKGYQFETLDAGGGLGIFYDRFDESQEITLAREWGTRISKSWNGLSEKIIVEPGRWLVAHAGILITRVEYIKETSHHTFAIVDTGMHHLLRPALYQAQHRILPLVQKKGIPSLQLQNSNSLQSSTQKLNLNNSSTQAPLVTTVRKYQVVGPICESSDVLGSQVELENLCEGDFLALIDVGAYGQVMSSDYNLRPKAKEIFL